MWEEGIVCSLEFHAPQSVIGHWSLGHRAPIAGSLSQMYILIKIRTVTPCGIKPTAKPSSTRPTAVCAKTTLTSEILFYRTRRPPPSVNNASLAKTDIFKILGGINSTNSKSNVGCHLLRLYIASKSPSLPRCHQPLRSQKAPL
jgi:hypothetical protein